MNHSITEVQINKYKDGQIVESDDILAVEEPLEIKLVHGNKTNRQTTNVSITMRTPGNDLELAAGFLFTEGIIHDIIQLDINPVFYSKEILSNSINIFCKEHVLIDHKLLQRNFYTTSACGVCGKASIDAIYTLTDDSKTNNNFSVSKDTIIQLPDLLNQQQDIFKHTGGIHAAALFNKEGMLLESREDVGRPSECGHGDV